MERVILNGDFKGKLGLKEYLVKRFKVLEGCRCRL